MHVCHLLILGNCWIPSCWCLKNTTGGKPNNCYPTVKHFNCHFGEFDQLFPISSGNRMAGVESIPWRASRRTTYNKVSSQTGTMQSARKTSMGCTNQCASLPLHSHFYGGAFTPRTAITLKHDGRFNKGWNFVQQNERPERKSDN